MCSSMLHRGEALAIIGYMDNIPFQDVTFPYFQWEFLFYYI